MPVVGGQYFLFFSPVFNIADSSIFLGVLFIVLFQKRFFAHEQKSQPRPVPTEGVKPDMPVLSAGDAHESASTNLE